MDFGYFFPAKWVLCRVLFCERRSCGSWVIEINWVIPSAANTLLSAASRQAKGISQLLEGLDWNFIRHAGGSLNIYSSTNIASINNTRVTKVPLFPAAVIPRILLSLWLWQKQWPEYICAVLLHRVLLLATFPMNRGECQSECFLGVPAFYSL